MKLGARGFFWFSHTGEESQGLVAYSATFPGHKQKPGFEVEQLGPEQIPVLDPGDMRRSLACYAIASSSVFSCFYSFLLNKLCDRVIKGVNTGIGGRIK